MKEPKIIVTQELLQLIAEIDEFKGAALRHVATIESIGSSTRIEGSKLTDREAARLLAPGGIISLQGAASSRNPWAQSSRYRRAASSESAGGRRVHQSARPA